MDLVGEGIRKAIHVLLAVLPLGSWWLAPQHGPAVRLTLAVLAVVVLAVDLARLRYARVGSLLERIIGPLTRRHERTSLLGSTLYFMSLAACFLLFPRGVALAAMGYLIVGDALAAFAGRLAGRHRFAGGKSLEGSLACLAGCLVLAPVLHGLDPGVRLPVLLVGAVAATAGEAAGAGGSDNLTVPLVSGLVMLGTGRVL